jgi:L-asparaginase
VVNDEIHTARDVTKTNSYRLHTFQSRSSGVLGFADPDRIAFYRRATKRHTTESDLALPASGDELPRVEVLYVHAGNQADIVPAVVKLGAKGIVVAGTGAGATGELRQELAAAAKAGTVVVRSSRVGEGRIVRDDNWQEPGFVAADNLSPHKSALLLALGLLQTSDPERIQQLFDTY